MEFKMNVHRVSEVKKSKKLDLGDGNPIIADVHGVEVEFMSTAEGVGSWTVSFVGNAVDEAKKLFTQGEQVVLNVVSHK